MLVDLVTIRGVSNRRSFRSFVSQGFEGCLVKAASFPLCTNAFLE
jgi:hypothetical protein